MMHVLRGALTLCAVLSITSIAHAQELRIPFSTQESSLVVTMNPESPSPGEEVRISVTSSGIDLERSGIKWILNGETFQEGNALKEITVTTPPLGQVTIIDVIASDAGVTGRARVRIAPVDVDIVWSSDSYVPPLYKGRTLAGTNATIRTYALARFVTPEGFLIPENNLVYYWYRNNLYQQALSGRGKSGAVMRGPDLFGEDVVRVRVESLDKRLVGESEVRIPAVDTQLHLYEQHPLFGTLYHRAIVGDVNTSETEQKVSAVPYFAHTSTLDDSALTYEWQVNGNVVVASTEEPQTLTITARSYTGPARIELRISNAKDIVMRALGTWTLNFGSAAGELFSGTSLFGE